LQFLRVGDEEERMNTIAQVMAECDGKPDVDEDEVKRA
jgi:hypothetical protein